MTIVFDASANQLLTGIAYLDVQEIGGVASTTQNTVVVAAMHAADGEIKTFEKAVMLLSGRLPSDQVREQLAAFRPSPFSPRFSSSAQLFLMRDLFANGVQYGVFPSQRFQISIIDDMTAKSMSQVVRGHMPKVGAVPRIPHVPIDLNDAFGATAKVQLLIEFGGFLCYKEAIRILEEFRRAGKSLDLDENIAAMPSPFASYFVNIADSGWKVSSYMGSFLGLGIIMASFWTPDPMAQFLTGGIGVAMFLAAMNEFRILGEFRRELLPIV